jgi:hypothetical protein
VRCPKGRENIQEPSQPFSTSRANMANLRLHSA